MSAIATIVIPYAAYHKEHVARAYASAQAQTVSCDVVTFFDSTGRGAGWARNVVALDTTLPSEIMTPFIVFLDADDTLEPTFVEACLKDYQTGFYVYTNWHCWDVLHKPNICVARGHEDEYHSHLVTTLYPTDIFRALGGFDESLPGHEDVDFYLRSAGAGICGVHLDSPLVHYSEHGQRSEQFATRADHKAIMDSIFLRNGGQRTIMACCGGPGTPAPNNPGQQQAGDILAQTLWAGMRTEYSVTTGRVYTGGNGSQIWVNPADIALVGTQGQTLFKPVVDLRALAPEREQVLRESGLV